MEKSELIFKWLKQNYVVRKYVLLLSLLGIVELLVFYNLQITGFIAFIVVLVNIAIGFYFFWKLSNDNILLYLGLCIFDFNLFVIWVLQNSLHLRLIHIWMIMASIIGFYYFICDFFYEQEKLFESLNEKINLNEIKEIELFPEQVEDINRIMSYMDKKELSIIGINGAWGTGKTTLMKKIQIEYKKKTAIFINIDLMAMNIDDIFRYLLQELDQYLIKEGIISFDGPILQRYLSNNIYSNLFWKLILKKRDEYSVIFSKFKNSLNYCQKNVFIVFDDIDRIDNNDNLKKIFNISEKLSGKNIKIIYLYNQQRLEEKGFTKIYLQKYIPVNLRLSEINFKKIIDGILEKEQKYQLNRYRKLEKYIDKLNMFTYKHFGIVGDLNVSVDICRYIQEHFNIRAFIRFLDEIEFLINEYNTEIERNERVLTVLFASAYIKIFCPDFYHSIDINRPLLENFAIHSDLGPRLLSDINFSLKKYIKEIEKHSYDINEIQMVMSYMVLELQYFGKIEDSVVKANTYEEFVEVQYMVSKNNQKKVDLLNLQSQFYSTICAGVEFRGQFFYLADQLKELFSKDKGSWKTEFDELMNRFFLGSERTDTVHLMGISIWVGLFKSMYYAAYRWCDEEKIKTYNGIFKLFIEEESQGIFSLSIIENLSYFIAGLRRHCLKNIAIFVFTRLSALKVNYNLLNNVYFIDFQCQVFKLIVDFGYVDKTLFRGKNIDEVFSNKHDNKSLYNSYSDIYIKNIIEGLNKNQNILFDNNIKGRFNKPISEISIIKSFIAKINEIRDYKEERHPSKYCQPNKSKGRCSLIGFKGEYDIDELTEEKFLQLVKSQELDVNNMIKYINRHNMIKK